MFSTFDVYIAEASDENLERDLLKRFIVTYLTQDELDKLKLILSNLPNFDRSGEKPVINISQ